MEGKSTDRLESDESDKSNISNNDFENSKYSFTYPTYIISEINEDVTNGTWKVHEKSNSLITFEKSNNKADSLNIKELSSDKMVLSFLESDGDTITMYLKKFITE